MTFDPELGIISRLSNPLRSGIPDHTTTVKDGCGLGNKVDKIGEIGEVDEVGKIGKAQGNPVMRQTTRTAYLQAVG